MASQQALAWPHLPLTSYETVGNATTEIRVSDAQCEKVWWADPTSAYVKQHDIKPYFSDVDLENSRLQDMAEMARRLGSYRPYPNELIPDELRWYQRVVSDKDRNLPDAFQGHAHCPVISEAMRNVLTNFDLGSSQFFECPLYEILPSSKQGRTEADRSKQDPRRWFLFHVSETKESLNLDESSGLHERPRQPGFFSVFGDEKPTIALDRDIALGGPPIWREPNLASVVFYSDTVKRAIMAKGLRTPALKFRPCLLV